MGILHSMGRWLARCLGADKTPALPTSSPPPASSLPLPVAEPAQLAPAQSGPYDENLLERARTQWQFGDWESLSQIRRETLQHHPDRARIALLAASGHQQQGNLAATRELATLAREWGCNPKLISRILISGVHNTLGRAAAISGQMPRALRHTEAALATGAPGNNLQLLGHARLNQQLSQLGLAALPAASSSLPITHLQPTNG